MNTDDIPHDLSICSEDLFTPHALCCISRISTCWTAYMTSSCSIDLCYTDPRRWRNTLYVRSPAVTCIPCECGACITLPQPTVDLLQVSTSYTCISSEDSEYVHACRHAMCCARFIAELIQPIYSCTRQLSALPLRKLHNNNNNNNSECYNGSNANPQWSNSGESCGVSASHIKAMMGILASRQAAVYCLYVSITQSNVEPEAPM